MTEKRRDDRDSKKANERLDSEVDESMEAAELQVDPEREREDLSRFEPDRQTSPDVRDQAKDTGDENTSNRR